MEKYFIVYFIIGLIYGLGSVLKIWSSYSSLGSVDKMMAKFKGYGHWSSYLIVFVSRFIAWPVYIIMGACN